MQTQTTRMTLWTRCSRSSMTRTACGSTPPRRAAQLPAVRQAQQQRDEEVGRRPLRAAFGQDGAACICAAGPARHSNGPLPDGLAPGLRASSISPRRWRVLQHSFVDKEEYGVPCNAGGLVRLAVTVVVQHLVASATCSSLFDQVMLAFLLPLFVASTAHEPGIVIADVCANDNMALLALASPAWSLKFPQKARNDCKLRYSPF
mmetsp:Transcript_44760/g.89389  ORF Transcript_44760/g.89389 Transcript_44760/m.89389 type:complete len:204 (+) Transcript_44760:594-1205(+)